MDSWVWMLVGFATGIVFTAIIFLIFRKDSSPELEQLADDRGAQLSKAEMKAAVLQDRLVEAESVHEEECRKIEADYEEKLAAAEADYREKLATLEKQFADLDAAFAAQLVVEEEQELEEDEEEFDAGSVDEEYDEEAAAVTAAIAAKAALAEDELLGASDLGDEDLYDAVEAAVDDERLLTDEEADLYGFDELDTAELLEEPAEDELFDAALLATGTGAGAVFGADDNGVEQLDEEPVFEFEEAAEFGEEFDPYNEETIEGEFVEVSSEDPAADTAVAVEETVGDQEEPSAAAKITVAAGSAAIAAAVLSDDSDDEEEVIAADVEDIEPEMIAAAETADAGDDFTVTTEELPEFLQDAPPEDFAESPVDEIENEEGVSDLPAASAALAGAAAIGAMASSDDDQEASQEMEEKLPDGFEDSQEETGEPVLEDETIEQTGGEPEAVGDEMAEASAAAAVAGELQEVEEEPEPDLLEPDWPEDTSTWKGEFFNNMKLEGDPVLVREDAEIDFDWGLGSPAPEIEVDGFSVRWKRTADVPPGLYRFTVTCDDGARLWVDGRLVISAWYDHTEMTFRREMQLEGGPLELMLEYYENELIALIKVSWERIG